MPRRTEILDGPGGEGLAISCLALGVSKQDFATLFLLSRSAGSGGQKTSLGDLARATRLFDRTKRDDAQHVLRSRSEEHTSELQSLMRKSYAVFCLKTKK